MKTINNLPVHTILDAEKAIQAARVANEKTITAHFTTPDRVSMHPQQGIPQLHMEQMSLIAMYHHTARIGEEFYQHVPECTTETFPHIQRIETPTNYEDLVIQKLTRRTLQKLPEWNEWEASEFLQLDQYHQQDMFSIPTTLPREGTFNILPMIWNYLVKPVSLRKKARCIANGTLHQRGTITLANTYTACVEQPAARLF